VTDRPKWLNLLNKLPGTDAEKLAWWEGEYIEAVADAAKEDRRPVAGTIVSYYRNYLKGPRAYKDAAAHAELEKLSASLERETAAPEVVSLEQVKRARELSNRLRCRAR
jgi:hypothetical protein